MNEDKKMFEKEKRLIVLLSRVCDLSEQKDEVYGLVKDKTLRWDVVVKYLCRTKVMGLFWSGLKTLRYDIYVPTNIARILEFYYLGNEERNKIILREYEALSKMISESGLKVAPLKGISLLNRTYTDLGARQLNDIDLLVSHRDKDALDKLLLSKGFLHGHIEYDEEGKTTISKFDRMEEIIWKTKMNNLPPFYKVLGDKWCNILDIDCSFALDYRMLFDDVTAIIDERLVSNGSGYELCPEDFFIQICCHLYRPEGTARPRSGHGAERGIETLRSHHCRPG